MERKINSNTNDKSINSEPKGVSVHVHCRIAVRAGYLGTYELYTLMLRHPILSYVLLNIASNYLPRMIRTIARKAYTLLKNAKTKTKRVDIIIPVEDNSLLIVRTIGFEPFETFKGIPEPDELCQALISAMQKLGRIRGKQTGKLLLMEAMVSKKESQISVRISRRLDSKLGPALKQQIENAKSEKPVSLNLEAPNLKKQQRSRKQKTPKGRR